MLPVLLLRVSASASEDFSKIDKLTAGKSGVITQQMFQVDSCPKSVSLFISEMFMFMVIGATTLLKSNNDDDKNGDDDDDDDNDDDNDAVDDNNDDDDDVDNKDDEDTGR